LNQFILHSSLDIAEEVQWSHGQMYVASSRSSDIFSPPSQGLLTLATLASQVSEVHRQVLR
jgi:hypothetical protein